VEVGVYKGGTAYHLAEVAMEQGRAIYLYDTFTGIPWKDEIDTHPIGDFGDTSADAVRAAIPYAKVLEGVFPDTLVEMGPIAFVHLDVDQYRSYMDCLRVLVPMMVPGGAMVFDDYGWLDGATVAVNEFFGKERVLLSAQFTASGRIAMAGKAMVRF
jgi:O-methyltransferase